MKKYLHVLLILTLISCNGNEESVVPEIESSDKEIEEAAHDKMPSTTTLQAGEYLEYYESGQLKIKGYHNQSIKREGLWISYYESGIKWSESYYIDGKKDGHTVTFFPNGSIRYVGEYDNDEKVGKWTFYDETGIVTHEEQY